MRPILFFQTNFHIRNLVFDRQPHVKMPFCLPLEWGGHLLGSDLLTSPAEGGDDDEDDEDDDEDDNGAPGLESGGAGWWGEAAEKKQLPARSKDWGMNMTRSKTWGSHIGVE